MSTPSSIRIPKVYETRQHSAKEQSPMSSSSSTYSSSPQTPASANPSSKAAQKQRAVHERRPSLLSAFQHLSSAVLSSCHRAQHNPPGVRCCVPP